jgi:hypothetical protein
MIEFGADNGMMKVAKRSSGFSFFRIPALQQNTPVSRTAVPEKGTPTLRLAASAGSPKYGAAVVLYSLPFTLSLPRSVITGGSFG